MPVVGTAFAAFISAFLFVKLGANVWWWAALALMVALLYWRWMHEEWVEQPLRERRIVATIQRTVHSELEEEEED